MRQLDAAVQVLQREKLAAVAELARRDGHRQDGCLTAADWLAGMTRCARASAVEQLRVAERLAELPRLADALAEGRVSVDQLAQLVRFAAPETDADWAREAPGLSVEQLARLAAAATPVPHRELVEVRRRRHLRLRPRGQAVGVSGLLTADAAAAVAAVLERLAGEVPAEAVEGCVDRMGARWADALTELVSLRVADVSDGARATVVVHGSAGLLTGEGGGVATLEDGTPVADAVFRRLACDAHLEVSADDAWGNPVGLGRASRHPSPELRRRVRHRDQGCRFFGCGRRRWGQLHHNRRLWSQGGLTNDDELIWVCGHHHHLCHDDGWQVRGDPRGPVETVRPDGTVVGTTTPGLRTDLRMQLFGQP
ncbi:MAG: DUF222 domain-containing protein [Acidimicrobiales bacterium]|nr:DUF222 domain-containing protein [Acidimicrobiales bacterium]